MGLRRGRIGSRSRDGEREPMLLARSDRPAHLLSLTDAHLASVCQGERAPSPPSQGSLPSAEHEHPFHPPLSGRPALDLASSRSRGEKMAEPPDDGDGRQPVGAVTVPVRPRDDRVPCGLG